MRVIVRKRHTFRPGVSALEQRIALSNGRPAMSAGGALVRGTTEITVPPTAWGESKATLVGVARVFGVGRATFRGTLIDNATPVHWQSHGEFVLTTPKGSVTLY